VTEFGVSRHDLAGIPVFALEGPAPIPSVGLTFRVGRVDETAPTAGITHLVEHLILPARIGQPVDYNGTVDELFTSLWARGDPDDLVAFLSSAVELLERPPLDRLEIERRTLLAEEATQSFGGPRQAFALRYGPHGPGLSGYAEYGLRKVGASDVESFIASRFTRENTAVWISGVSLEQLEIGLAGGGGVRDAPVVPSALDELLTPSVYAYGSETGVCLSMLGGRSRTTALALDALADGLLQRLRYELGHSYAVNGTTQALSGSLTQLTVTADVADENVTEWLGEAIGVLDSLVEDGPADEWLERTKSAWRRYDNDPGAGTGWVSWRAEADLLGRPFQTHADAVAERESVTAGEIARYLADARSSLLVLGPYSTPVPPGFEEYPVSSTHRVQGKRHRPKGLRNRLRRDLREVGLISGDDGVTWVTFNGQAYTATYDSAAVCLRRPGERTLLSHDGFFVTIERDDWVDGDAVFESIDRRMPEERTVRMDADGERFEQVHTLAHATFGRKWLVSEELGVLPHLLEVGEELLLLAQASRGWRIGLVALTDRRLHFVYADGQKHTFVAERGAVTLLAATSTTVELENAGEHVSLTEFRPSGTAQELANALAARA
jgi:zinc protease